MQASWKFNSTGLAISALLSAMSTLAEDGGMTSDEIGAVRTLVSDCFDELASQTELYSEEREFLLGMMAATDIAPNEFEALEKLAKKIKNKIDGKGEKHEP